MPLTVPQPQLERSPSQCPAFSSSSPASLTRPQVAEVALGSKQHAPGCRGAGPAQQRASPPHPEFSFLSLRWGPPGGLGPVSALRAVISAVVAKEATLPSAVLGYSGHLDSVGALRACQGTEVRAGPPRLGCLCPDTKKSAPEVLWCPWNLPCSHSAPETPLNGTALVPV